MSHGNVDLEGHSMQSITESSALVSSAQPDSADLLASQSAVEVQVQLGKAIGLMDVFSHRNKERAREALVIALQKHRQMMERMGWRRSGPQE